MFDTVASEFTGCCGLDADVSQFSRDDHETDAHAIVRWDFDFLLPEQFEL